MDAVVSMVCVAGAGLGMFLIAVLLMQEHRSHGDGLLAGVIGLACLGELFSAAEHLSQVSTGSAVIRMTGFPGLLFAPLLFLYFRSQSGAIRLRVADTWHFSCYALLQSMALLELANPESLHWSVLQPYLNLACLLVIATYALASMRVICSGPVPRLCSVFHDRMVAVVALMAALASYLFSAAANVLLPAWPARGDLADALLSCAWAVLAYSAIRRAMSREAEDDAHQVVHCAEAKPEPEKTKYGNNRLPDFARESIVVELQRHMQAARPWLKIDLTLGELAAGINVSPHHLSQIINSEFGKSFAGFINEYRVGEACQLLAGDNDRSVLEIALDSGFSSKSSFNATFKKHTGMTPSEYRKTPQEKNYLVA